MINRAYNSAYLMPSGTATLSYRSRTIQALKNQLTSPRAKLRWRFVQQDFKRPRFALSLRVGIWIIVLVGGTWAGSMRSLPGNTAKSTFASTTSLHTQKGNNIALAAGGDVRTLPGGPTGQLLPPGTIAAPGTYRNSYAGGQCTWYVAGRRQVPGNWGNANTWYPRAKAAGWSVGTVPAIGAIATTTAGYFGHVAIVTAINGNKVTVTEMNYRGPYIRDERVANASDFKYIY